ncbi:MAG: T9SS type A sorting domain-containing protein [Bacteroidetes bacterium]|nr:T9SS type A sorting domain-containing protein [Bacteroidota bacterium]
MEFYQFRKINSISILNLTGQEVLQSKMNSASGQVNVSALPKGIYILKIFSTGVVKTFKINKL